MINFYDNRDCNWFNFGWNMSIIYEDTMIAPLYANSPRRFWSNCIFIQHLSQENYHVKVELKLNQYFVPILYERGEEINSPHTSRM